MCMMSLQFATMKYVHLVRLTVIMRRTVLFEYSAVMILIYGTCFILYSVVCCVHVIVSILIGNVIIG